MFFLHASVLLGFLQFWQVHSQSRSRSICQTMHYRNLGSALQMEHQCILMEKLQDDFEREINARGRQYDAVASFMTRLENKLLKKLSHPNSKSCKGKGFPHLKGVPQSRDCNDLRNAGINVSGVYTIMMPNYNLVNVYCDMDIDDGGWTVIQRRNDGSENFTRTWNDYMTGFGNVNNEFWLGNQKIHHMTVVTNYTLRVDIWDFEGNHSYALYDYFYLENERDAYRLNIGAFLRGPAGDSLYHYHNRVKFSTYDKDNDHWTHGSCAKKDLAGWWFRECAFASLNGIYKRPSNNTITMTPGGIINGIYWYSWEENFSLLKKVEMKIRPRAGFLV